MGDFIKIFLGLSALVISFIVGRGYGEKTYVESEEYKKIIEKREELDFAKNEFENAKAKLQNIVDRGDKEKTEELLAQILQVFLADLGLKIQNRDLILKQAELKSVAAITESTVLAAGAKKEETIQLSELNESNEAKESRQANEKEKLLGKLKSNEWLLINSDGGSATRKGLDKVVIKNLKSLLSNANIETGNCEAYLGEFSGNIKDINKQNQGSISFTLKQEVPSGYFGKIAWFNSPNPALSQNISNTCGSSVKGLSGRFFNLTENRYAQIYKLQNSDKMAGNFYEILPGGTTKRIGTFELKRIDRF